MGIGLITALTGLIDIKLVVPGTYTILTSGDISLEIIIAFVSLIIIGATMELHIQGGFAIGLVFGALMWWLQTNTFPKDLVMVPQFSLDSLSLSDINISVIILVFNLVFLYILTLNGLAKSLSDLSKLTFPDGSIPRGNWLLVVCGISTIISGYFCGPPILISPESAAAIKSGAKTGFSVLICGIIFGLSTFFSPLFSHVPPVATSPLLILVGMLLFQNADRIQWSRPSQAIPAFFVILMIPFTCSILNGIGLGYILFIIFHIINGQFLHKVEAFVKSMGWYDSIVELCPCLRSNRDSYLPIPNHLDDLHLGRHSDTFLTSSESHALFDLSSSMASSTSRLMNRQRSFSDAQAYQMNPYQRRNSLIDSIEMDLRPTKAIHPLHAL